MKKTEQIIDFGQDEGIIKIDQSSNDINLYKNNSNTNDVEIDKIELQENQYLKFFELNEDGLKLYGKYKKEQWLTVLKWSTLGTVIGFSFSILLELYAKKMSSQKKDLWKTGILFMSVGFLSFQGLQTATNTFKKRQIELVKLYGKEV